MPWPNKYDDQHGAAVCRPSTAPLARPAKNGNHVAGNHAAETALRGWPDSNFDVQSEKSSL
jgi:hypothetical protein